MNISALRRLACVLAVSPLAGPAFADTFGAGTNQFTMDFVTISGATNPTSEYGIVNNDYRMGKFEITNDQWNKFKAAYGTVTGTEPYPYGYEYDSFWTGENIPTNRTSWYEAAQFVNWLNTSTGHQAAYKFTGTQGTSSYALDTWSVTEAAGSTNLYRHRDAFYFLPSENEWVKAAYWNGTSLQTYATMNGAVPTAGIGGANYNNAVGQPWNVGSGTEELNGTFDMMGNAVEWMEGRYDAGGVDLPGSLRTLRGGSYYNSNYSVASSNRNISHPSNEDYAIGFRVASEVPEPSCLVSVSLAGVAVLKRRRR